METILTHTPHHHIHAFRTAIHAQIRLFVAARKVLSVVTTIIIVVLFVTSSVPVHAKSSISIDPAFSQVELSQASSSASVVIRVQNNTDTDQTFQLQAVDIQQVDSDGNVQLREKPAAGNTLSFAAYVEILPETLLVPAGQSEDVSVLVRNSNDLSPGGHYAAVVVRGDGKETASGQTVIPALTSFVLVNKKGGEKYHISLSRVEAFAKPLLFALPRDVELRFSNDGNTHVSPFGMITISDVFGRTVREGLVNEGSKIILPQSDRDLLVPLRPTAFSFPLMLYRVRVSGATRPGDIPFDQDSSFVYISPLVCLCTAALATMCGLLWYRRRKKL